MKHFIFVLGPQGSGKSTQAKRLAKDLDYRFISMGDLLRNARKDESELSSKIAEYELKGDLVPDEIIEAMLFAVLNNCEHEGFVIDGYPRNSEQLKSFLSYVARENHKFDHAFYLDVSIEECLKRLALRVALEQREDETDEVIKRRLEVYFANTAPLLIQYEKLGVLRKVNGERIEDEIEEDIKNIVENSSKDE